MFRYYYLHILSLISITLSYADNIPSGCTYKSQVCVEGAATREINGVAVYQSCWKWKQTYTCPDWSNYTNSCDKLTNCVENGAASAIDSYQKTQQYKCTSHWSEKKCTKYESKKTCSVKTSYADGFEKFKKGQTDNFGKNMAYMQMLNAINKNMTAKGANLKVFTGEAGSCKQPKKRGPFQKDCCDINLTEHGSSYQNQCDAFDFKIAMARRNNRAHYVGTWCSIDKPIIGCIENRQGYCLFADEMARIIQEQGRAQINELILAGKTDRTTTTQITFNLFSAPVDSNGVSHPDYRVCDSKTTCDYIKTTGGFMIRPYQYTQSQQIGTSIKALYRLSLSDKWQSINIPIDISENKPLSLSTRPLLSISGKCRLMTGVCSFNVKEALDITEKSWGDPEHPKCDGFSDAELKMIDFSKIDLSSYVKHMKRELSSSIKNNWKDQTSSSINDFKSQFTAGNPIKYNKPQGEQVVKVSPKYGTGGSESNPFRVTLTATSNFPKYYPYGVCSFDSQNKNVNPVSKVIIDWGNKSTKTTLTSTVSVTHSALDKDGVNSCDYLIPVFQTTHTYQAPPNNQTTQVPITVKLYTKSNGTQTTIVTVQNVYQNDTADDGSNYNGQVGSTGEITLNQGSNGKVFDPKGVVGIQTNWKCAKDNR